MMESPPTGQLEECSFFRAFFAFVIEIVDSVERARKRQDDMQLMTAGRIRTLVGCGKNSAFIHGVPTLTTNHCAIPAPRRNEGLMHFGFIFLNRRLLPGYSYCLFSLLINLPVLGIFFSLFDIL